VAEPLTHPLRVRYSECDQQGVVFNAHYLAWFDINVTELWRAAFGSYQAAVDRGVDIVVAAAELRFRAAARFDEELALEVAVSHLGVTSIITEHAVTRDGERLVEGTLRHVMVDPQTLVKTAIPEWFRAGLAPWTVSQSERRPPAAACPPRP
jgi:acyl-CoA thioester hydrolase